MKLTQVISVPQTNIKITSGGLTIIIIVMLPIIKDIVAGEDKIVTIPRSSLLHLMLLTIKILNSSHNSTRDKRDHSISITKEKIILPHIILEAV